MASPRVYNTIDGVVGSIVGDWITSLILGINQVGGINLTSILVALMGAIVVVTIYRLIRRGR